MHRSSCTHGSEGDAQTARAEPSHRGGRRDDTRGAVLQARADEPGEGSPADGLLGLIVADESEVAGSAQRSNPLLLQRLQSRVSFRRCFHHLAGLVVDTCVSAVAACRWL